MTEGRSVGGVVVGGNRFGSILLGSAWLGSARFARSTRQRKIACCVRHGLTLICMVPSVESYR